MLWLSFKDFDSCPSIKDKLPLTSPPYLSSFFLPAPWVPSSPRCAETGILTILGVLMILQACIPGSPDYSTNECAIPSSQMGSLPNISLKKGIGWDFAGSPVVKTSPHNAGVADLIPGWGAKISGALGPKIQNIKQEQCSKFKKDLKNDPHYKRNLKRNWLLACDISWFLRSLDFVSVEKRKDVTVTIAHIRAVTICSCPKQRLVLSVVSLDKGDFVKLYLPISHKRAM